MTRSCKSFLHQIPDRLAHSRSKLTPKRLGLLAFFNLAIVAGNPIIAPSAHADSGSSPVHFFESDLLTVDTEGQPALSVSDSHGVLDAMLAGDTGKLLTIRKALEQNPGPEPAFSIMRLALCDAAIARTQGDIERSTRIIREALQAAQPWSNPAHSVNPFNFMLITLLSGNFLLEGNPPVWANARTYLEQKLFTPIRAHYEKPSLNFSDVEQLQLTALPDALPSLTAKGPRLDHVSFNPFATIIDDFTMTTAATKIDIDGSVSPAIINTGTVLGAVPASLQRQHHWPQIGTFTEYGPSTRPPKTFEIVRVPSLTLGHTTFRNQMMMVIQSNFAVIGLQTLGVLRRVVMNEHEMTFGPDVPFTCRRHTSQLSSISGFKAGLLLPVTYEGKRSMAIMNTGENYPEPLVIDVARLPNSLSGSRKQQKIETASGTEQEEGVTRTATLQIDGHLAHGAIRYRIGKPDQLPTLTMSALEGRTLAFDLRAGIACLD